MLKFSTLSWSLLIGVIFWAVVAFLGFGVVAQW